MWNKHVLHLKKQVYPTGKKKLDFRFGFSSTGKLATGWIWLDFLKGFDAWYGKSCYFSISHQCLKRLTNIYFCRKIRNFIRNELNDFENVGLSELSHKHITSNNINIIFNWNFRHWNQPPRSSWGTRIWRCPRGWRLCHSRKWRWREVFWLLFKK